LAQAHFKKAGLEHLMTFRVGDAAALLEDIEGPFDIVFNDIDKEFYPRVIDPVYEKLRPGGLFITDNTLWHGRVVRKKADRITRAVQEFNRRLQGHEGFMTAQVPLRDGLGLAIKL
jgi:caffeoyl-CoA O-methyltransferase